jgi:hypothetical protein
MTYLLGAGTIRIEVTLSRALACSVAVEGSRPKGLNRMFVGRMPEEAPALAAQVFSLCGFAQSVAARLAVLNAADLPIGESEIRAASAGLLAERIFETLRALVLHWPVALPQPMAASAGLQLRSALQASQAIVARARSGSVAGPEFAVDAARLADAARALGVPADGDRPLTGSVLDRMEETLAAVAAFPSTRPDPLLPDDDDAVIALLCGDPDYAAMPHLPGRVIETGAYARKAGTFSMAEPHLVRRLRARVADVASCLSDLAALATGRQPDWTALAAGGPTPGTGGYGSVECARGRLYHQAEIGEDGRLSAYRILAPTEWNFHPAGPFVETLLSSPIGAREEAAHAVALLAVLFDPCVAFEVDVREDADA